MTRFSPKSYTRPEMVTKQKWKQMLSNKHALRRVTIVDEVQGVIRGYIAIWGSPEHRDSYQTWFDREQPPELGLDFLPIPLIYEHGFDGGIKKEIIGSVARAWFDDIGIRFEAILDKTSTAFSRFIAEIRSGKLKTSSATAEHLAEFDSDGRFVNWPLSELTLTANPAEEKMPAVQLMRSNLTHDALGQSQGETRANERKHSNKRGHNIMLEAILAALNALGPDATTEQIIAVLTDAGLSAEDFAAIQSQLEVPDKGKGRQEDGEDMPEGGGEGDTPATAEVVSLVDQLIPALTVVMGEKGAAEAEGQLEESRSKNKKLAKENAGMALRLAAHRSQQRQEQAMPNTPNQPRHGGGDGRISVGEDVKYAGLNARQMLYGHQLLQSIQKPRPMSESYLRHMAGKLIEEVDKGYAGYKDVSNYKAIRSALGGATRADELVHTGNTGAGEDWIPESWSASLWEVIRQDLIMEALQRDMMILEASGEPGSSKKVPLEAADPTWYSAAENTDVAADLQPKPLVDPSTLGTANVEVTPGKAMVRVIVSTEMVEDSIVPVLAQLDKQISRSAQDTIENLFLNGDTETGASANINLIDGTPAGGTTAPVYLVTDGALKYALVTGTSTSQSGGVLTSDDFLDARGLLPNNLLPDPTRMIFISDNSTMLKSLRLTDWKDISVSLAPTQESGIITMAWGTQYLGSGQMATANTAGKIPAAGAALGRLLLVVPEYWAMVWKRQIRFNTQEDIDTDTTKVVGSLRVAFKARSAGAATVIYNLTV